MLLRRVSNSSPTPCAPEGGDCNLTAGPSQHKMNRSQGEPLVKTLILSTAILIAASLVAWSADSAAVTYLSHDKVAAALAKGGPLVTASDLLVQGSHRTGPGHVEVHDKETDVFYVTDGAATLITGGTMLGGKTKTRGQWGARQSRAARCLNVQRRRDRDSCGGPSLVQRSPAVDHVFRGESR